MRKRISALIAPLRARAAQYFMLRWFVDAMIGYYGGAVLIGMAVLAALTTCFAFIAGVEWYWILIALLVWFGAMAFFPMKSPSPLPPARSSKPKLSSKRKEEWRWGGFLGLQLPDRQAGKRPVSESEVVSDVHLLPNGDPKSRP